MTTEPYEPRLREVKKLAGGHTVKNSKTPNTLFYTRPSHRAILPIEKVKAVSAVGFQRQGVRVLTFHSDDS